MGDGKKGDDVGAKGVNVRIGEGGQNHNFSCSLDVLGDTLDVITMSSVDPSISAAAEPRMKPQRIKFICGTNN